MDWRELIRLLEHEDTKVAV